MHAAAPPNKPRRGQPPVGRGRLLISCPDQPGIVATLSEYLFNKGANIVDSDQHTTDPENGHFFMRIAFDLPGLEAGHHRMAQDLAALAERFAMDWRLEVASRIKRVAVFVSKEDHCLLELLWQWQSGDLPVEIAMVISNHRDLAPVVAAMGIPFHHVAVSGGNKAAAEAAQLALMADKVDLVVLARYMQIISGDFISHYPHRIINIHHSFLPAFVGAKPYNQAYDRGVKLIGATAHYVTEDLDAGPIIEQDVHRVTHRDSVENMKRIGRHVERLVLARAVKWHVEDRILVHGNKTVVFA